MCTGSAYVGGVKERTEVGSLEIAYVRAGSGPPLVLLHGYVGDGPSTWRHQIDVLSSEFTVLAWDAPGAGLSTDPPEYTGMNGYADCLAPFLAQLGIERAHICGLSFGGALAIAFTRRYPAAVQSLVLTSAYAGWAGSLPADEAQRRLDQALRLSHLTSEEFCATLLPTMFRSSVPARDLGQFAEAMAAFHPAGFRAMARASAEDLRSALPGISVPTLLIYGEDDVRAPRGVGEQLQAAIKGSRLVFVSNAGHLCTIESPAFVNREIRGFLRSSTSP
jgi:pimeloyl-ACP methyl ester carboxylesterase